MQAGKEQGLADVVALVRSQLQSAAPELATVSIALGILEAGLCHKDPAQRGWPAAFQVRARAHTRLRAPP